MGVDQRFQHVFEAKHHFTPHPVTGSCAETRIYPRTTTTETRNTTRRRNEADADGVASERCCEQIRKFGSSCLERRREDSARCSEESHSCNVGEDPTSRCDSTADGSGSRR